MRSWCASTRLRLLASAYHLLGQAEDAQDLAQETFIEAYRRLSSLREGDKLSGWLFTILRHKCLRFLQGRRPAEVPLEQVEDSLVVPEPAFADQDVWQALQRLSLPDREILAARYLQELSFAEIAVALDISVNNAEVRCSRARTRLRGVIRELEEEETRALMRRAMGALPACLIGEAFLHQVLQEVTPMMHAPALTATSSLQSATSLATKKSLALHLLAQATGWKTVASVAIAITVIGAAKFAAPHLAQPGKSTIAPVAVSAQAASLAPVPGRASTAPVAVIAQAASPAPVRPPSPAPTAVPPAAARVDPPAKQPAGIDPRTLIASSDAAYYYPTLHGVKDLAVELRVPSWAGTALKDVKVCYYYAGEQRQQFDITNLPEQSAAQRTQLLEQLTPYVNYLIPTTTARSFAGYTVRSEIVNSQFVGTPETVFYQLVGTASDAHAEAKELRVLLDKHGLIQQIETIPKQGAPLLTEVKNVRCGKQWQISHLTTRMTDAIRGQQWQVVNIEYGMVDGKYSLPSRIAGQQCDNNNQPIVGSDQEVLFQHYRINQGVANAFLPPAVKSAEQAAPAAIFTSGNTSDEQHSVPRPEQPAVQAFAAPVTHATILTSPRNGEIGIRGGATMGLRVGMECTTMRRDTVTGRIRLTAVAANESTGSVLDDSKGIAPGDTVLPIAEAAGTAQRPAPPAEAEAGQLLSAGYRLPRARTRCSGTHHANQHGGAAYTDRQAI